MSETQTAYPDPQELNRQADALDSQMQSVVFNSETPSMAKATVELERDSLREYAAAIQSNEIGAKRPGMTGEERRERRAAILRIRAARLKVKSAQAYRASHDATRGIPFGQPILVGHHSERSHRNAIERAHNAMGRSVQASNYAEALESRADRVENSGAILSGDSDAVEQLQHKLNVAKATRETMVKANKLVRRQDVDGLVRLGLTEDRAKELLKPDFCGRVGFADFELSNLGANIRRMEKRLAELRAVKQADESGNGLPEEETHGEITLVRNRPEYRIQLMFPGKPDEATRTTLKSYGFRWSPSNGAWQRHLNNAGEHAAKAVLSVITYKNAGVAA